MFLASFIDVDDMKNPFQVRAPSDLAVLHQASGRCEEQTGMTKSEQIGLAEKVRDACLRAALEAHEDAGISGLCAEGRWEIAVQAIRTLDVQALLMPPDTTAER